MVITLNGYLTPSSMVEPLNSDLAQRARVSMVDEKTDFLQK
jgi:hypothetical protein